MMRAPLIASVVALAALLATADFLHQSQPFKIILLSQNLTLHGSSLAACHEGASIKGLCISGGEFGAPTEFTYNTSQPDSQTGILTYQLQGKNFNMSSPMQLSSSPSSNVAGPLIQPGIGNTLLGFDKIGRMFIMRYEDDTKPMPNNNPTPTFQWYVCQTHFGYLFQTLTWGTGNGKPQNPTCDTVQPLRVFM